MEFWGCGKLPPRRPQPGKQFEIFIPGGLLCLLHVVLTDEPCVQTHEPIRFFLKQVGKDGGGPRGGEGSGEGGRKKEMAFLGNFVSHFGLMPVLAAADGKRQGWTGCGWVSQGWGLTWHFPA